MRVIAGSARRLPLKTVDGNNTRPTTDRIKETLFNMLQNDINDCTFLDMFSGSGAIGIEALSRGAKKAYFVDNETSAVNCIKENLLFTKLSDSGIVMECNFSTAISKLENLNVVFDIIFMDPPYNKHLELDALVKLSDSKIINHDSLIIVEASDSTEFDYLMEYGYKIEKVKEYKTNKHVFITLNK